MYEKVGMAVGGTVGECRKGVQPQGLWEPDKSWKDRERVGQS